MDRFDLMDEISQSFDIQYQAVRWLGTPRAELNYETPASKMVENPRVVMDLLKKDKSST